MRRFKKSRNYFCSSYRQAAAHLNLIKLKRKNYQATNTEMCIARRKMLEFATLYISKIKLIVNRWLQTRELRVTHNCRNEGYKKLSTFHQTRPPYANSKATNRSKIYVEYVFNNLVPQKNTGFYVFNFTTYNSTVTIS